MYIRKATRQDIDGINKLLGQVLEVHHDGRPDLFKSNAKKYTDAQLIAILQNEATPVFVAVNEEETILGYAFCLFQQHLNNNILTDIKTLYIDDLCVDKTVRGQHIGKALYAFVVAYAKENNCYNVTLNVWACNKNAIRFYEKCGLTPQKIGMEIILK